MKRAILLHRDDNVATLIDNGQSGDVISISGGQADTVTLTENVPFGHKCAVAPIEPGSVIRKYGEIIGRSTTAIGRGQHAHVHNIEALKGRGDLKGR